MTEKISLLRKFLDFCRTKKVGDIITRREVLKIDSRQKRATYTTVDGYRKLLESCGYLKHISAGVYQKIKPIPILKRSEFYNRAYVERWKNWFVEDKDTK
jgi:hypothetical protein